MKLKIKKKTEDALPERGPAGKQGLRGSTGPAGKQGERGKTGATGPVGPKGSTGRQGEKGEKGDLGDHGKTGAPGPIGPTGPKGSTGRQGEKGDTGAKGLKGDRGPIGPRGLAGKDGADGNDGIDAYEQWIEQGHRGSTDDFIRALKGTPGKQGEQGERGPRGLKGLKGDKGEKGNTGARGADGWGGGVGPAGADGADGPTGADGADGQPGVDGQDGVVSPRVRGVAVLSTDVAANTTVSTSTNATGTFLDYSGVTFADDVEIHINGVLMRCGATSGSNYDVYPAGTAANGDFACEFNIKQGDVIQQFIGGGGAAAGRTQSLMYVGYFKSDGVINNWYGQNATMPYWTAQQATSYSNASLPGVPAYYAHPLAQFTGTLTEARLWVTPGSATNAGDFAFVKIGYTDDSSTTTEALIDSVIPITTGTTGRRYDYSTTFTANNTINAGDGLGLFYRSADGLGTGYLYYSASILLEES